MTKSSSTSTSSKPSAARKAKTAKSKPPAMTTSATTNQELKQQILAELSKFYRMKKYSVKTILIAKACGFQSVETKRFRNAKKELKDQGKIEYKGDTVELSQQVIQELKEKQGDSKVKGAKSNKEHHDMVKQIFKQEKEYKNVCNLIDMLADGKTMEAKQAAIKLGYANIDSKGYRNAKNILKAHEYLVVEKGGIKLAEEMFPFGRPNQE